MTHDLRRCPTCNYENAIDAKICVQCGTPLSPTYWASITTQQVTSTIPEYPKDHPLAVELPPNTMAFVVEGYPEPGLVQNVEKILLGRVESIGEMYLFDFTVYGGQFQGVSRRHAIITRENNTYILEDENSTNGTWINQTRLQPHRPYPLTSGDALRLGKLSLRVYFTTPRVIDEQLYLQKFPPNQPLTPDDLASIVSPYLLAVSGIQKVINTLLRREAEIVSIQAIERQNAAIRIHMKGASETIQFLKTKLSPNPEEATSRLDFGDHEPKTIPPENAEQISELGLALMSEIAAQMQNQVVSVDFHMKQLRPYLQVIVASQLKIVVPSKKNG